MLWFNIITADHKDSRTDIWFSVTTRVIFPMEREAISLSQKNNLLLVFNFFSVPFLQKILKILMKKMMMISII